MTNQPYYGFESGLILKTLINSGNGALKDKWRTQRLRK